MKPKAVALHAAVTKAHRDLQEYQRKCKHEHKQEKWCSSDDDGGCLFKVHWRDVTCLDCGKKWSER